MPSIASRFALLACCLTASCAISSNARRSTEQAPQANNPVVGGASLAMTAFRATAVATVKEPITTAKLGVALLWTRPREAIVSNLPLELTPEPPQPKELPGTPEFEKLLDQKHFQLAQKGSVKWLVDGRSFFPELDRQIAKATKLIDVQVFIFDNDDVATKYADILKERSKQVKVRVLFDDLGSTFAQLSPPDTPGPAGFTAPMNMANYLERDSKVRARRILNPWLASDHTKLLVFDQQCAMLGGMNIGREYYSEWHDLMACVDGPVVTTLAKDFNRAWRKAGWGDFASFRSPSFLHRNKAAPEGISIRPLRTDPATGQYENLHAFMLAIRSARKRIWIENPYFAQDELVMAVANAARRGVDVRVILPAHGDSTIMDVGNVATERYLIQSGAKIYRYPRMTHMKVMLCDGWGTMGSANLDTLSMRINRELNIAFRNPEAVKGLETQVFLPDFKASKRIRLADTDSNVAPLAEMIADQL